MNRKIVIRRPEDRKRDGSLDAIQKVGAAILKDQQVLVVRKIGQGSSEYFMAGGRMEAGETQKDTLVRELKEELGVDVASMEFIDTFSDLGVFEGTPIVIHAYIVGISGNPSPQSEVREYKWINRHFAEEGIPLSSIMATKVIPELIARGLM